MSKKQFTFIKDTIAPNIKTPIIFSNEIMSIGEVLDKLNELSDENEQLKQRNNRQYEQLGRLYNLIEQKQWKVLTDIVNNFKKSDEQLQKEWGTYGDVE